MNNDDSVGNKDDSFMNILLLQTDNEDEELLRLLQEWNLEKIYMLLLGAHVGIEELRYLNESDLDKIFPSFETIGIKAKFREKLKLWKKEKFGEEYEITSDVVQKVKSWIKDIEDQRSSIASGSPTTSEKGSYYPIEIDIQSILKQTPRGQDVLEYFKENNILMPHHQQSISNCVIDHFIACRQRLRLKDLETIANKICAFFPGEQPITYYTRRGKQNKPCGKIYDRYFNHRRKWISTENTCRATSSRDDTNSELVEDVETDETLAKNMKAWLTYNDKPVEEVIDKWKRTYHYRTKSLKTSLEKKEAISNFMLQWPLYKNGSLGPCLIDCDFSMLYPNKDMSLLSKWELFIPKIKEYYKNNIKDKSSREILSKLDNQNLTKDSHNYIIALLLNAVITPVARYKEGKKSKKVTIQEGMDSFILLIQSSARLEEEIINIRNRFSQENMTLQPLVIVIGSTISNVDEFFVYLDGIKLKFSSFLAALDTCFKVFHVFDLKYPIYCRGVWLFIQKFFFEIDTKYDQHEPKVSGLITFLKSVLDKH